MIVRTPLDELFNYSECKESYEEHRDVFEDEFDWIINNSYFYSFYKNDGTFIGCIFYYPLLGKLMVNAYATRGHHKLNLECLRESLTWFDNDIYAQPETRASRLCLIELGFEKVENILGTVYLHRSNNNEKRLK